MTEERFDRIEERLDRVEAGQQALRMEVVGMGQRVDGLEQRVEELDRHMHVLHEDTIARIAAIPEYTGPTKAEMDQGFAGIRELIARRIDPLEAVVRRHSIEIARLKRTRR
jgi:hypothetical protein